MHWKCCFTTLALSFGVAAKRSAFYPITTLVFYYSSSLLPSGGSLGAVGYVLALLAFILNLPGVLLIQRFYHSGTSQTFISHLVFPATAVITWCLCVVPVAYLIVSLAQRFRRSPSVSSKQR